MHFILILSLLLSAPLLADSSCEFETKFSPEDEDKESVEKALSCRVSDPDLKTIKEHASGLKKIVSKLHLYPVYDSTGKHLKFISFDGEYKKNLVLVLKPDKKLKDEGAYSNFEDFEKYKSNDFRNDVVCFAGQVKASIAVEKDVMKCIDFTIDQAMKYHKIEKIRTFSVSKLRMVAKESSEMFDTKNSCTGFYALTFFQGKVYNSKDMGNFIWGAILQKLKVSDFMKKAGSTLNGYIASGRQNDGFFKSTHILGDHPKDQVAIFEGARWIRETEKAEKKK